MFEAMGQGIANVFSPVLLLWIFLGVLIGMIVGILPGLGGSAMLAILLPMCYKLNPTVALTFLIALHACVYQGGAVTSILFGIPGETTTTATIFDGYAMAKKGMAGRALANSQTASALGGIFGALVLAALIPVAKPIILAFGAPELFMVAVMGLTFVAGLTGGNVIKSLIPAAWGLVLAFVGYQDVTGVMRFTGGILFFWEGVRVVPLFMGLFAIPEIIDMVAAGQESVAGKKRENYTVKWAHLWLGIKDVFRNWWLVIRCSAIGTVIGIIPGIGGMVAQFICYGHAKQTSKYPEKFGEGFEEGVIAPQSGDNAKEGGALLTTLAFGIPGSAGMVLILAAMMILGVKPGPDMIVNQLDLLWTIIFTLIMSNIVASLVGLVAAKPLAQLTFLRMNILVPIITVLVILGSYGADNQVMDVLLSFFWGFFGYFMKMFNYNRVTFLIAYVLGDYIERYFLFSLDSIGPFFLLSSPQCIVLIVLTILGLAAGNIKRLVSKFFRRQAV